MLLERPQVTARDFFFQNQNPAPLHALCVFMFFHFFLFHLTSGHLRSSQVISSRLARANFISAYFMWQQMCCAKESPADILCKQQCAPLKFGKLHVCLTHKFTNLRFYDVLRVYGIRMYTVNFANLPNLPFYDRKRHAQMVNLRFYLFTGHSSGTMELTILWFYRFTARLGKRRALAPRLAHRHHRRLSFVLSFFLSFSSLSLSLSVVLGQISFKQCHIITSSIHFRACLGTGFGFMLDLEYADFHKSLEMDRDLPKSGNHNNSN